MADQFDSLQDEHAGFIRDQRIFFVATAAESGRVNLSPKGQDSLRVVSERELLWLNLTGSGNETAAHLLARDRITLMWCAFEGAPRILRVYGRGRVVHPRDPAWADCARELAPPPGARQYVRVEVQSVQVSCGYGVPLFDYRQERPTLLKWGEAKGPAGIEAYWREKNQRSIDGLATDILP